MWKFNLIQDMKDPTKVVFEDNRIVVLEDAYPKAEKHFLILPREEISNLTQVKKCDLQLLKHMDSKGKEIAEEFGGGRVFKLGYHADPSMERLHLHVMSDDMNAPGLKYMKHWNNFTTPMFIKSSKVMEDLKTVGEVMLPSKRAMAEYLKTPLKCHKCEYKPNNMLDLKTHILIHLERIKRPADASKITEELFCDPSCGRRGFKRRSQDFQLAPPGAPSTVYDVPPPVQSSPFQNEPMMRRVTAPNQENWRAPAAYRGRRATVRGRGRRATAWGRGRGQPSRAYWNHHHRYQSHSRTPSRQSFP